MFVQITGESSEITRHLKTPAVATLVNTHQLDIPQKPTTVA